MTPEQFAALPDEVRNPMTDELVRIMRAQGIPVERTPEGHFQFNGMPIDEVFERMAIPESERAELKARLIADGNMFPSGEET